MARLGLTVMALALIMSSFGGLLPSRALGDSNGPLTELVVCTPAGLQIIDLATGEMRLADPSAAEHSADLLCLLCLPLAGDIAAKVEAGVIALLLATVDKSVVPPSGAEIAPSAQGDHQHQPRAPPVRA